MDKAETDSHESDGPVMMLRLRISQINAVILAGITFIQGCIVGYGASKVGAHNGLALALILFPIVAAAYAVWLYRRTGGLFSHTGFESSKGC